MHKKTKSSLRTVLIIAFVIQIITVVTLTGLLSFYNGRKAVDDLASQLRTEITARISQHLSTYIAMPHLANQMLSENIQLGFLKVTDISSLKHYLWHQAQHFKTVSYLGIGTENAEYVGAQVLYNGLTILEVLDKTTQGYLETWETDKQGHLINLRSSRSYDPRRRPWYRAAVTAGKPIWSDIYVYVDNIGMGISANQPIYDAQANLMAVASVDLTLLDIGKFLKSLKIGRTGQTFIMTRSGALVATSTSEEPFRFNPKQWRKEPFKAVESRDVLTRATARFLSRNFDNFSLLKGDLQLDFILDGVRQFLQVLSFRDQYGLDWLIVVVVPETDFMARIYKNTRLTFLLLVIALILATLAGVLTARWIVHPIHRLTIAAQRLSTGQWDCCNLPIERTDEIGQLAQSFSSMATQLQVSFMTLNDNQEKLKQLNDAYQRFVPYEFLNLLNKESVIEVQLGDYIEREMTILFADIRGFTTLSEGMTPKENFDFINNYLSQMEPIIDKYHGFIDKYIGDAIMALFPTNADDAVSCAIAMLTTLEAYNQTCENHALPLRIGIGLNTGPLMLGTVGGKNRMDGTVIADAVNLASRVESLTKQYGTDLLITHHTYQALADTTRYQIRIIDRVIVKGKSEPITLYEIFDAKAQTTIDVN